MSDNGVTSPINDRRRTAEATKSELIAATKRLLRQGIPVAKLSTDRIVAEAGLARATYYLHFRSKFDLIAALMDDAIKWRDRIGAEVLESPDMSRATLDAILTKIVHLWTDDRTVLSAIIEVAEYDARVAERWQAAIGAVADEAAIHFRARWAGRADAPPDVATIALLLSWMFERACHQMLGEPDQQALIAAGMSEIIWRVLTWPTGSAG